MVRRLVVGVGDDGRSTVVADGVPDVVFRFGADETRQDPHHRRGERVREIPATLAPGEVVVAELWATEGTGTEDATGDGEQWEVECPREGSRWRVCYFGPDRTADMHVTETVDYDTVLHGEVTLLLDDREVDLAAGDTVVVPGVRHGWRTGSTGCVMVVAMLDAR